MMTSPPSISIESPDDATGAAVVSARTRALGLATSPPPVSPVRLAVLLSGTGRSLANLLATIERGELAAEVVTVVSSVEGAGGLTIARDAGIPALAVPRRGFGDDASYSEAILRAVAPARPSLLVLAGFLRKLVVPEALAGRILNIHPALLPEASYAAGRGFYGERVHAAVLAHGATESGATVHVVDNGYDTGPVVLRARVPVQPGDTAATLGTRVFAAECVLYPEAIRRVAATLPGPDEGDDPWAAWS
ncbi:MAG: Phosphoribosylglycinamide formyltransferase [uncultured Thermomicrobiales bacterium]|uniref:Phosphoribosylglycinamide formyltransferase n=1 Tax=uncultured Thermomicrobiales bacterium TaxID=1645740 RepID=A0A6J4UA76_9BACT|nr:MAG: Phosphoribosylglycinamide formyltransferase [uncultured Thermomicrobiales bacterium]